MIVVTIGENTHKILSYNLFVCNFDIGLSSKINFRFALVALHQ
jgi:hypothetical protein